MESHSSGREKPGRKRRARRARFEESTSPVVRPWERREPLPGDFDYDGMVAEWVVDRWGRHPALRGAGGEFACTILSIDPPPTEWSDRAEECNDEAVLAQAPAPEGFRVQMVRINVEFVMRHDTTKPTRVAVLVRESDGAIVDAQMIRPPRRVVTLID